MSPLKVKGVRVSWPSKARGLLWLNWVARVSLLGCSPLLPSGPSASLRPENWRACGLPLLDSVRVRSPLSIRICLICHCQGLSGICFLPLPAVFACCADLGAALLATSFAVSAPLTGLAGACSISKSARSSSCCGLRVALSRGCCRVTLPIWSDCFWPSTARSLRASWPKRANSSPLCF